MTPNLISHYRIIRKLGAGGMGEVFLAQDTKLERQVAIKCLAPKALGNEQAEKRLIREAKAAATLDHPNICTVHEVGEDGDRPFIVMQYVEGDTLSWRLRHAPPDVHEAVHIAAQVAEALIEAHSRGVVHRDIKPQNLIITPRGQVKVLDFGLAKWVPERAAMDTQNDTVTLLTDPGMVIGTVRYMSPEQIRGERVDARSDLFALGALLYECVTGKPAFSGSNSMDICAQVIHVNPQVPSQLNPQVSAELESVILKALAKDSASRYQSASEMLEDLRRPMGLTGKADQLDSLQLAGEADVLRARGGARLSDRIWRGSRGRVVVAVALPIVVLGAWLALHNLRSSPNQPTPAARDWYEKGANGLREGAYYQASKALQYALGLDKNFALAHARLAEAYAELDYTVKAKDELLIAQSLVPDRAALSPLEAGYLKAISGVVTRDFTTAIETYREMVEQSADAEKPGLLLDLGRSYEKNENLEQAIATYQEVTRRDSQSAAAFLRLAILFGREQDLTKAKDAFDKAEEIYQLSSNTEGQAQVLYQRGILLSSADKLADGRAQLEKALRMARDANNTHQQIRTLLQLSAVSWNEGNTVQAKQYAAEAIESAQANDLRSLATNGLIDLGYASMARGELEESGESLKRALEFAQTDKARLGEARALLALGNLHLQQDNPDDAIRCLSRALGFYQESKYMTQTSTCLLLLARANRQKGEYETALQVSGQTLQLAKELNDPSREASAQSNFGYVLGIEQERYAEGLEHMDQSYQIDDSLGDTQGVGYDLLNRGRLLSQLGRYDEARAALSKAFSIANHPDASYKLLLSWVYLANAQMSLGQGRFAEAKKQSQKALDVAPARFKDVAIQAKGALGLARALSGAPRAGKALCEEAVSSAREMSSPRLLSTSLLALAEVMLMTNDFKGALDNAITAQKSFERYGQQDSEWRALLIAARASKLAGSESARDYANQAASLLSSFQQKWSADAQRFYLARPDVQVRRNQLEQIRRSR